MGEQTGRASLAAGSLIANRYQLIATEGSGGMAQVWRAQDTLLSRPVAVKILHPHLADDPSFVSRFRREAVAAARLVHPGIVSVYDTVSGPACEAIVIELIDGITLREHLDDVGKLDDATLRRFAAELAGALDCAHRNGIIHRDIKPANILIGADGGARLADFGIAKADEDPDLTVVGTLVGTATYIAPEQVRGTTVDQRSDLYSLSVVLYEAASGATPFTGDSPAAIALARLHQPPAPLAPLAPQIQPGMVAAIMRNLHGAPEQRFQSASAFFDAVKALPTQRRSAAPKPSSSVETTTAEMPIAPSTRRARKQAGRASRSKGITEQPSRRPPRTTGSIVGRILIACLILGPAGIVIALMLDNAPSGTASSTTVTLPPRPVTLSTATPFDPQGTGSPGENNRSAPLAIDGDPETAWRTETYEVQTFGTKDGVGLIVELEDLSELASLELTTSEGWKGQVFVTPEDPSTSDGLPPNPIPVDAATSRTSVDLDGTTGRFILIWITDLGGAPGKHRVEISDVEVMATGAR